MSQLNSLQLEFWNRYLASLTSSERPVDPDVTASHPGGRELADELVALYLAGKKWAGSGLVRDYEAAGDPLPQVGRYWMLLDSLDRPRCIVKVTRTEIHRFDQVPEYIAQAEGEGDLSLDYWRKEHARFFAPYLEPLGIMNLDSEPIVTEFFEMVFSPETTLASR